MTKEFSNSDAVSVPAMKSAWDAVKGEVTKTACWSAVFGFNIAMIMTHGYNSNMFGLTAAMVGALCSAGLAVTNGVRAANTLKKAPMPQP